MLEKELSDKASETWKEIVELTPNKDELNEEFVQYKKLIDYNNNYFKESLLPLYFKMHKIFTDNFWLAEESTTEYYKVLSRYIDLWERHQKNSIPQAVLFGIDTDVKLLEPFKDDIKNNLDKLKNMLVEK